LIFVCVALTLANAAAGLTAFGQCGVSGTDTSALAVESRHGQSGSDVRYQSDAQLCVFTRTDQRKCSNIFNDTRRSPLIRGSGFSSTEDAPACLRRNHASTDG
jgi:hypothetical protein